MLESLLPDPPSKALLRRASDLASPFIMSSGFTKPFSFMARICILFNLRLGPVSSTLFSHRTSDGKPVLMRVACRRIALASCRIEFTLPPPPLSLSGLDSSASEGAVIVAMMSATPFSIQAASRASDCVIPSLTDGTVLSTADLLSPLAHFVKIRAPLAAPTYAIQGCSNKTLLRRVANGLVTIPGLPTRQLICRVGGPPSRFISGDAKAAWANMNVRSSSVLELKVSGSNVTR